MLVRDDVGVDVVDVPRGVRAEARHDRHVAARREERESASFDARRRRRRGRSRSGRGRRRSTTRGGRLHRAAPSARSRRAGPPASRPPRASAAHRSTFTLPATIIFITSSVSASVTRRPPTIFGVCPSFFWSSVACGPPPCTTTTRSPARAHLGHVGGDGRRCAAPCDDLAAELDDDVRSCPLTASRPGPRASAARRARASGSSTGWPGRRRP